jgi:hypothetical protein
MAERQMREKAGPGKTHPPPMAAEQFLESPEFRRFRTGMKRLLTVPKEKLDRLVENAKADSPRAGNPNAPGRKRFHVEKESQPQEE